MKDGNLTGGGKRPLVVGIGGAGINLLTEIKRDHPEILSIGISLDPCRTTDHILDRLVQLSCSGISLKTEQLTPSLAHDIVLKHVDDLLPCGGLPRSVCLVVGFGGASGSGAFPVIVDKCMDNQVDVQLFSTMPFDFESAARKKVAEGARALAESLPIKCQFFANQEQVHALARGANAASFDQVNKRIASLILAELEVEEIASQQHAKECADE